MDNLEKRPYNIVWEKFNKARTVITACQGVFNYLRRICDLAMIPTGPLDNVQVQQELTTRLFELKEWATYMDQFTPDCTNNAVCRSCNILELFGTGHTPLTATLEPSLDWRVEDIDGTWEGMTEKLQHILICHIDFHSMRTGSMESLLQSTNELISA
jgi:hypothetical protein